MYPNPTTGREITVEIESFTETTVTLRVVSVLGEELLLVPEVALHSGSNAIELPLSAIEENGFYHIIVRSTTGSTSVPLIIER